MSRAYDVASTEAHKEARSVAYCALLAIQERCPDAETLDDAGSDERYEVVHECVDNALIYTADQWLFAYGLPEQDIDDMGGMDGCDSFNDALARQAYVNLQAEVFRYMEDSTPIVELLATLKE